jgi:hypothetical protein
MQGRGCSALHAEQFRNMVVDILVCIWFEYFSRIAGHEFAPTCASLARSCASVPHCAPPSPHAPVLCASSCSVADATALSPGLHPPSLLSSCLSLSPVFTCSRPGSPALRPWARPSSATDTMASMCASEPIGSAGHADTESRLQP